MKRALLVGLLLAAGIQANASGYLNSSRTIDESSAIQGGVVSMNVVGELRDVAIAGLIKGADQECGKKTDILSIKIDENSAGPNKEVISVETYCRTK